MTNLNINQDKAGLYKKIVKVMSKVSRVPKNGWNSYHRYKFVAESDLIESVRKFMVDEGLVLFHHMREYEIQGEIAIVTVDFTLCDSETGESITTTVISEGMDKGDKKFFKALTGATKYYLMKTFLIPSGDDPEADITTDQRAYGEQQTSQNQVTEHATKPISGKQIGLIKQRMKDILTIVDQEEEALLHSLRERVGEFKTIESMTSVQASRSIEQLTKWKETYQKRNEQY